MISVLKRYVKCITLESLKNKLIKGFKSAGCTSVSIDNVHDTYCKVNMVLPDGTPTSVTVWFDSDIIEVGKEKQRNIVKFTLDSSWTYTPSGDVLDMNGNIIGHVHAVELNVSEAYRTRRRDYKEDTIRVNSSNIMLNYLTDKSKFISKHHTCVSYSLPVPIYRVGSAHESC